MKKLLKLHRKITPNLVTLQAIYLLSLCFISVNFGALSIISFMIYTIYAILNDKLPSLYFLKVLYIVSIYAILYCLIFI